MRTKLVVEEGCDFFVVIKEGHAILQKKIGIRGRLVEVDNLFLFCSVCVLFLVCRRTWHRLGNLPGANWERGK